MCDLIMITRCGALSTSAIKITPQWSSESTICILYKTSSRIKIHKMPPKARKTVPAKRKRPNLEINSVEDSNQRERVPTPPAAKKRKQKNLSQERRSRSSTESSPSNSQQRIDSPSHESSDRSGLSSNFEKYLQVRF